MPRKRPERTLYVIAYDIPSDRRRSKLHKTLSGFGQWTQYSLFECYLSEKERLTLRHKVDKLLDVEEDSVRFYPLCENCVDKVETIGSEAPEEPEAFIV